MEEISEVKISEQEIAYTFLDAFYNNQELGFSMQNYTSQDLTPEIISLVDKMGNEIITNVRLVAAASTLYDIALKRIGSVTFLYALLARGLVYGSRQTNKELLLMTKDSLIEDRELIRKNILANATLILILNNYKTEIYLRLLGIL